MNGPTRPAMQVKMIRYDTVARRWRGQMWKITVPNLGSGSVLSFGLWIRYDLKEVDLISSCQSLFCSPRGSPGERHKRGEEWKLLESTPLSRAQKYHQLKKGLINRVQSIGDLYLQLFSYFEWLWYLTWVTLCGPASYMDSPWLILPASAKSLSTSLWSSILKSLVP